MVRTGIATSFASERVRRAGLVDAAGAAAAALLIFGGYVSASRSGGDPDQLALLTIGVVATVVVARAISSASRAVVPVLAVVAATAVALSSRDDLFSSWALSGPFGYDNAKSGFFGLAALGGLALAVVAKRASVRTLGWIAAVAFAAVPIAGGTIAVASLLPAAAVGVAIKKERTIRIFVWGCALVAACTVLATFVLGGSRAGSDPLDRFAARSLSERRLVLWHEAVVIMRDHPLWGVGPGRFQSVSPTARSDRDSRWAHNEFLQTGAETGIPGLVGLVGVFAWAFARASAAAKPTRRTVLAALAVAFLGVQASVDYVLHFPAIPLLAAALVGGLIEPASEQADGSIPLDTPAATPVSEPTSGGRPW
jgi:O-antigen ligase